MDKRLNLNNNDPINNLLEAKYFTYPRTIKNIGLNPFFCHYWSDEQEILYKVSRKEDEECELLIDATGSLALPIILPNGKRSPHLMLYLCVCKTKNFSFPASHMISSKQDAQTITDFLAQIKKHVLPPRKVISDFGNAIIIAVAKVFANCIDLQDYLKRCYRIVFLIELSDPLSCFIRLDISHFVKMVCSWSCIKQSLEKAREFVVKVLCYVYKCKEIKEIKKTLKALLVVLLSKDIGYSKTTGKKLKSQIYLEKLDERIRGITFEEPETTCDQENYDEYENIDAEEETDEAEAYERDE